MWDAGFERECHALVEAICAGGAAGPRDRAWQALLAKIAPHLERWAEVSPALRRVGLTGEDEPRAVLVDVIDRLCDRDFANLRAFLARQAPDPDELSEAAMVEGLARLAGEVEDEPSPRDQLTGTPLRGWLVVLTRFVIKEHIKRRFGWRSGVVAVGANKRDVGSGAERLDAVPELGERPPLSTLLGVRRALDEIRAYTAQFPAPMQRALTLWLDDVGFDAIAAELALPAPREAQALVRAAQARLRDRFRGAWPELFG